MSWAEHGPDAREGQAAANRPLFLGPLGREYLPAIPDVDAALRAGGRAADVGCGLGWSSIGIALAYPDATVDGYDVDLPSIEAARRNAREAGVDDRVRFHTVDAADGGRGARTTPCSPSSASTTCPTRSGCWRRCGGSPARAAPSW